MRRNLIVIPAHFRHLHRLVQSRIRAGQEKAHEKSHEFPRLYGAAVEFEGLKKMRYRRLGQSGLFVSELCLGTMTFGGSDDVWGQIGQLQQEAANDLVRTALDAGVNFFDTANVYAGGNSEKILGQSLKDIGANRDEVVIATKVHGQMGDGPNARGTSRYHILGQVEASLERLQVDHIDLYQIHGFDPATPIEETLDALDWLVSKGTIRYYGLSNWAAWQVMKAIGIAAAKKTSPT